MHRVTTGSPSTGHLLDRAGMGVDVVGPPASFSADGNAIATTPAANVTPDVAANEAENPAADVAASAADASDMDDVMRLVYANDARPTLHQDLWREIAKYGSRWDLLNLRATSTDISKWVDRSITSLTVTANCAPAILAALANAENLNYIRTLQVENCDNDNLSAVIRAIASIPHAALHLVLVRNRDWSNPLYQLNVERLGDIAPASFRLSNFCMTAATTLRELSRLRYPIYLSTGHPHGALHDQNLRALADIPQLVGLEVMVSAVGNAAAQALGAHPALTELSMVTFGAHRIVLSDRGLTALANSATLRTLHLARIYSDFDEAAIAALAANRVLEHLCLGGPDDVFDEPVAFALSRNVTLKTLHISLAAGCGHLAKMPSLQRLFISGNISLDDARQFAEHAHLKQLHAERCEFAPGALAVLAACPIEQMTLNTPVGNAIPILTEADIDALLANSALRSLTLVLPTGPNSDIAQAIRLARHPTLTSLSVRYLRVVYAEGPRTEVDLTLEERATLAACWGTHRSADALSVTII